MEVFKNEQGQSVYPENAAALLDDHTNSVFDNVQYEALKTKTIPAGEEKIEEVVTDPASGSTDRQEIAPGPKAEGSEEVVDETKVVTDAPVIDYDAYVKEKTAGKFEKFDDVLKKVEEAGKPTEFANETSKNIYDSILKGDFEPLYEHLAMQKLLSNIDKLSPSDIVKVKIQLDNPEWDQKQVDEDFDLEFGLDVEENELSDEKLKRLKGKQAKLIDQAAKGAKTALDAMKSEIKLPAYKDPNDKSEYFTSLEKEQEDFKKMNDELVSSIDKDISEFKDIDLSFTDKDAPFSHKFEVKDSEKKVVADQLKDYWKTFVSRYYKDGKWQTTQMMKHEYIISNLDKIIKSSVAKARTTSKIETAKNMANSTSGKPANLPSDFNGEAAMKEHAKYALS